MSTYVTNVTVGAPPTSPAEAAAAEVARLARLIANVNEHAALCEHPTVNRLPQAAELRQHAAELEQHRQELCARIAAGEFATNAEDDDDETPLIMPAVVNAIGEHRPAAAPADDDDGFLVMPQMQF